MRPKTGALVGCLVNWPPMRARMLVALVALPLLGGCDYEGAAPGVRGQCAAASGEPLCVSSVETPEDACWKLVECGSIPVANEEEQNFFDYANCLNRFDAIGEHRSALSMACIEASTCDQLRFENGPNQPRNNSEGMPACLEYGDPE